MAENMGLRRRLSVDTRSGGGAVDEGCAAEGEDHFKETPRASLGIGWFEFIVKGSLAFSVKVISKIETQSGRTSIGFNPSTKE